MTGNRIFRLVYTIFALVALSFSGRELLAQNVKFQAMVSKTTVAEGERFRLEFKLNASGDKFTPPKFEGFRILSGPNQSTSMQFVNGRSSYSISHSYVLMALKEGKYTISPASIKSESDVLYSNEITIIVVKGKPPAQSQGGNKGNQNKNTGSKNKVDISDGIFIKATVSDASPYVGEQMVATYKLYFNFNIVDNSYKTLPSLTGFWSEDLDTQNSKSEVVVVKGVRFNVVTLKKTVLIPQRAGDLIIDPLAMDLVIQQPVQSRSRNIFDQFFGNFKNVKVTVASSPVKVKVKALPGGRPAGFNGAVGEFKLDFTADRNDVKANEAINLNYVISGSGNLKLLNKPNIDFPGDFEVYDPKTKDRIKVNASGMSGSRSFTYLAIPRHKGVFKIEPIAFSYFDTKKEKYVTLTSKELIFNIEKGDEENAGAVTYSGMNKEEVKLLGSDIRFIKTQTLLTPVGYSFFGSFWHYFLWLLPVPLFFISWQIKKKVEEKRSDTVYMRKSKANKMAVKRLSAAKKLIANGDDKKFYEEIFKALYGFFENKFNIKTAEINKDKIMEILREAGLKEELINSTIEILNKCEMARFAPMSDISHEQVYQESVSILSDIQKAIK